MAIHVERELLIEELTRECIEACSAGGRDADPYVSYWRVALNFTVNRERAIECLAGYGAWEREELTTCSDGKLAERVLWIACGDFSEYITEAEDEGLDPFGNRPDGFYPNCGSDVFVLE